MNLIKQKTLWTKDKEYIFRIYEDRGVKKFSYAMRVGNRMFGGIKPI